MANRVIRVTVINRSALFLFVLVSDTVYFRGSVGFYKFSLAKNTALSRFSLPQKLIKTG